MTKTLLIVPTRNRPEQSVEFYNQFAETSSYDVTLCFGLDDDDVEYPRIDGVLYEVNPRAMMNGTLNLIANKYANDYDYIAFMGDDHRPRTKHWDLELVETIIDVKYGIAYGNDLLQGANLPTAVLLDARIVRELGFMAPPAQKHLYLDNFWKELGERLGTLVYRDDVIIEHMHYLNGKATEDAGYQEVNSSGIALHDLMAFNKYKNEEFEKDLAKLV
jgi:hypothetical protein